MMSYGYMVKRCKNNPTYLKLHNSICIDSTKSIIGNLNFKRMYYLYSFDLVFMKWTGSD